MKDEGFTPFLYHRVCPAKGLKFGGCKSHGVRYKLYRIKRVLGCFQYKSDAEIFYGHLKRRMKYFGLELEESKTRLIEFGRFAESNRKDRGYGRPETFTFLGFTHYCSHGRTGKFRVKRKTSRKKLAKKSREINAMIRDMRFLDINRIVKKLNEELAGYYHYYGITDNSRSLNLFYNVAWFRLFYWLNRKSQRRSNTKEG